MYPFAESDSFFGELELFDESKRKWGISAKNKVIVYVIPKNEFLKLFTEFEIRMYFFKFIVDRYTNLESYERDCGRNLRRQLRVKKKFIKEINKTKNNIKN